MCVCVYVCFKDIFRGNIFTGNQLYKHLRCWFSPLRVFVFLMSEIWEWGISAAKIWGKLE